MPNDFLYSDGKQLDLTQHKAISIRCEPSVKNHPWNESLDQINGHFLERMTNTHVTSHTLENRGWRY